MAVTESETGSHAKKRNAGIQTKSRLAGPLPRPAIGKPSCILYEATDFRCLALSRYAAAPPAPWVWSQSPCFYGRIVCMKKTFNVDDELFKEAKAACGATTDTATLRLGLEAHELHGEKAVGFALTHRRSSALTVAPSIPSRPSGARRHGCPTWDGGPRRCPSRASMPPPPPTPPGVPP